MSEKIHETHLAQWIRLAEPVLSGALDAVAVVDLRNQLAYANPSMKTLLKLRPSHLAGKKKFCDCITLSICAKKCQIEELIQTATAFRFDESPAVISSKADSTKLRVNIRGVAVPNPDTKSSTKTIGAVITLRDTSADVLVQAKYHKLAELLKERDETIAELRRLNAVLRRKP
ncbi:MAG TPA: PAS domain-containing protein [Oligoflexia bacterium]|nr:PAS domain-containing protein [Oligoflexia bacterium]